MVFDGALAHFFFPQHRNNHDRNAEQSSNNKQDADSLQSKFRPIGEQKRFEGMPPDLLVYLHLWHSILF